MALQYLDSLLIPRSGKHHRHGNGKARRDELLDSHVHAVAHPGIVCADHQVDLIRGMCRRARLTDNVCRGGGQ